MTTLGVNVGDEFIREGIRAALDHTGFNYRPFYVNKHDPASLRTPVEDEVEVVADKYWDCDIFIQSGAPVYWWLLAGSATSVTSEWHEWLWNQRILQEGPRAPLFLNLGAGSGQPWNDDGSSFLNDGACAEFAMRAGKRAAINIVRDRVALKILNSLEQQAAILACPAFLAAERNPRPWNRDRYVAVNLMPKGGHYDLTGDFPLDRWKRDCTALVESLRKAGPIVFIAHDHLEKEFCELFAEANERVFFSESWRDYLDVWSGCSLAVANRVHGAVLAAGFGIPALILGNDTRALIGEPIGLPILRSGYTECSLVIETAHRLFQNRRSERERLTELRKSNLNDYLTMLGPALALYPRK